MIITVAGTHAVRRAPDLARLNLAAQAKESTAAAALDAASGAANEIAGVLRTLTKEGTVSGWTLEPVTTNSWTETDGRGRPRGEVFEATASLTADFTSPQALAAFAAAVGRRQGIRLQWTEWRLSDDTRDCADEEVLGGAIAQARRRAEIMARAAGHAGVELVELSDPGMASAVPMAANLWSMKAYGAADESAGEAVDVTPRDLEISATVQARFETR